MLSLVTLGLPTKFIVVISACASLGGFLEYLINSSLEFRAKLGNLRCIKLTNGDVMYATKIIGIVPESRTYRDISHLEQKIVWELSGGFQAHRSSQRTSSLASTYQQVLPIPAHPPHSNGLVLIPERKIQI